MNNLSIAFFIAAVMILFAGCYMLMRSYNMIRIIIAVEVVIKAVTLVLILAGYLNGNNALAQSFIITIIIIETVIAIIGIGIAIIIYRRNGSLDLHKSKRING